MHESSGRSNSITIIVVVIFSLLVGLGIYGFFMGVNDFKTSLATQKQERRIKLAALMPPVPANFSLVKDGYDPKANCFDKCGFEYRYYAVPSMDTVCAELVGAIQADRRGLAIEQTRDKTIDSATCQELVQKARQSTPVRSVSFYVVAPMKYSINDHPVTAKTRFARLVIDPEAQQIRYSISQEYVNYTFAEPLSQ